MVARIPPLWANAGSQRGGSIRRDVLRRASITKLVKFVSMFDLTS
jgi:hypothetical protein